MTRIMTADAPRTYWLQEASVLITQLKSNPHALTWQEEYKINSFQYRSRHF